VWKTAIQDWHDSYGITSAPLYYDPTPTVTHKKRG